MKYEISKKYRTIHSISDFDVDNICRLVEENNVKKFLDYGCHMGHLSIELALSYDIEVTAVDNFTGSLNDPKMGATIQNLTGIDNFFDYCQANIKRHESLYKGSVNMMYSKDWHEKKLVEEYDMVFLDSSHTPEKCGEFVPVCNSIKSGGVVAGHDLHPNWPGVQMGIDLIQDQLEWILKPHNPRYSSAWFQRKK